LGNPWHQCFAVITANQVNLLLTFR